MVGVSQKTVDNILENFSNNNKFIEITKTFKPFIYNIWNLQKKSEEELK